MKKKLYSVLGSLSFLVLIDYLFYRLDWLNQHKTGYSIVYFLLVSMVLFNMLMAVLYKSAFDFSAPKIKIIFYIVSLLIVSMFTANRLIVINQYYGYSKSLTKQYTGRLWRPDAHLAHRGVAHEQGTYDYFIGDSIRGSIETNLDAQGYRAVKAQQQLPYDTCNLFLGCSFTFGDYVLAEESYSYKASALLKNNYINAGASAYGIGQMKYILDSLLPQKAFRYVFLQLSPWLVDRAMNLNGPTFYGYRPFPYFSDQGEGFAFNYPAYNTRMYKRKNWRNTPTSYLEKARFMCTDGLKTELFDYLSAKMASLKVRLGLIAKPTARREALEQYFYEYAIQKCHEHHAIPVVLKLRYPADKMGQWTQKMNEQCTFIDLDADLDAAAAKAGKAYPDVFGIYHVHKGKPLVFDEHPNALAHEMIAQKIARTLGVVTF